MLVLSRRPGEKIRIGKNIEIVVVSTARNVVRLGIVAPKDIPVFREEVLDRMEEENVLVMDRHTLDRLPEMHLTGRVVLDFSNLDYIASTGLNNMVALHNRLKDRGGELIVRDPNPNVLEVIQVTKLDTLLRIELTNVPF